MTTSILQVENLVKRYGDVQAVGGVTFAVEEGEVFGLLGPNGAGKTSTIEILEGLRNADSGKASVCGFDPRTQGNELKHEIGATLQATSLPDKLRTMDALRLFASFYQRGRNPEELLKRFGLEEKRNTFYKGCCDKHGCCNFSRCFWLTSNGIHCMTTNLSDSDAGANYG